MGYEETASENIMNKFIHLYTCDNKITIVITMDKNTVHHTNMLTTEWSRDCDVFNCD